MRALDSRAVRAHYLCMSATVAEYVTSLERTLTRYAARAASGSMLSSDEFRLMIGAARSLGQRTGRTVEQVLAAFDVA